MSDTVTLPDGTELNVVDAERDSSVIVVGATVSGSQKENLGNYENVEPYASVRAEFRPAIEVNTPDAEDGVRSKLAVLRRVVDDHLQQSIDRTVAGREMD